MENDKPPKHYLSVIFLDREMKFNLKRFGPVLTLYFSHCLRLLAPASNTVVQVNCSHGDGQYCACAYQFATRAQTRRSAGAPALTGSSRAEVEAALLRLSQRGNFLRNPRFLPLVASRGGKSLVQVTKAPDGAERCVPI